MFIRFRHRVRNKAQLRPRFYFCKTNLSGVEMFLIGTEMAMPGDYSAFDVELITPIAIEEKLGFVLRAGGRTRGAGIVAKSRD